jgi:hypothetical protein
MLSTVHRTDDNGIGVERNASNLAAIGQFEDALSNLKSATVNLVKKDETGLSASGQKPIGSVPSRRSLAANLNDVRSGKAKKVTLSHLRATTLNDGKAERSGNLIDNLALADAVTATNEDGLTHLENVRSDRGEGSEIDSHDDESFEGCSVAGENHSRQPFLLIRLLKKRKGLLKISFDPLSFVAGGIRPPALSTYPPFTERQGEDEDSFFSIRP